MCHFILVYNHKLIGMPDSVLYLHLIYTFNSNCRSKKTINVAQLTGSYYYLLNFSETFTSVCSNANLYLGSARLSEKNVGASWPLSFHFWSPEQAF